MDYWPTARWKMVISDREGERWLEPSLPFALIGSHPCCEGRIDEIRVPPVAYFACCFDDSIEVWPVCPIAFPRWGLNEPEHSLAVGKHRVSLFHQSHPKWEKVAGRGNRPTNTFQTVRGVDNVVRQITLDWDGKNRKKTLDRRVLIMGDDHPSTLRLYGQGLTRCNYAVVSTGASVWMIDLNPSPETTDPQSLVRRLTSASYPVQAGRVMVRLGAAIEKNRVEPKQPAKQAHSGESDNTNAAVAAASSIGDQAGVSTGSGSTGSGSTGNVKPSDVETATPEALTSRLTDQLVRIDHRRFTRRRIIIIALYAAFFVICAIVLAWIVINLLLPMIVEMTAEAGD